MEDSKGFFGRFGGAYVSTEMKAELDKVERVYNQIKDSSDFWEQLSYIRRTYQGRPTPISYAKNLSEKIGGAQIYLKREDLNHTGSHKINHCIGEVLLAKFMGKNKVIAETGAGQHGVLFRHRTRRVDSRMEHDQGQGHRPGHLLVLPRLPPL